MKEKLLTLLPECNVSGIKSTSTLNLLYVFAHTFNANYISTVAVFLLQVHQKTIQKLSMELFNGLKENQKTVGILLKWDDNFRFRKTHPSFIKSVLLCGAET